MQQSNPLLPIEAGCLAMVIDKHDAENHGRIVTVIKFEGTDVIVERRLSRLVGTKTTLPSVISGRVWRISDEIAYLPKPTGSFFDKLAKKAYFPLCPESNLMRIDGYTEEGIIEKTEETLPLEFS